jgi:hypothetical protein
MLNEKEKQGVLNKLLKEMRGKDESFEKMAAVVMSKAAEGKSVLGGLRAAQKAKREFAEEYMIATKGTLGKKQALFEALLGRDLGNLFKNMGWEKMESPEKIAEAQKKLGIEKKGSSETKKGAKEAAAGLSRLSKQISQIIKSVNQTKEIVKRIEKALSKPMLKPGYAFDPRMAGGGRYRNEATNKLVPAKEALSTAKEDRTNALTAAIGADEDPLVKLREFLEVKLKDFDAKQLNKSTEDTLMSLNGVVPSTPLSIHNKLDMLLLKSKFDSPLGNRSTPSKPGPNTPQPKKPGGGTLGKVGNVLKTGARVLGRATGVAAVGMAAYDAHGGFTEAEKNLGLAEGQATTGQKFASAAGGVVSGLTFGLVDSGAAGRFFAGMDENPLDADLNKFVRVKDSSVDLNGLKPEMKKRLAGLAYEYHERTGEKIQINSGYRDPKEQAALYAKYGSPRAAPPGKSRHERGLAVDINSADADRATQLGLMAKYGFTRPVPGETWHIEPIETAGKGVTPDNPVMPGVPVVVANKGAKPTAPNTGTKPPAELTAKVPSIAPSVDLSGTPEVNASSDLTALQTEQYSAPVEPQTVESPLQAQTISESPLVAQETEQNRLQPVMNTNGVNVAQQSNSIETSKMVAQSTPAAPVVINNQTQAPQQPIQSPKNPLPMASTRSSESAFNRAIARDFSHPTSFTSSIVV